MPAAQHVEKEDCKARHRWVSPFITIATTGVISVVAVIGWLAQATILAGDNADKALFRIETIEAKSDERHISIERTLNNIETEQRRTNDRLDKFLNLGGK